MTHNVCRSIQHSFNCKMITILWFTPVAVLVICQIKRVLVKEEGNERERHNDVHAHTWHEIQCRYLATRTRSYRHRIAIHVLHVRGTAGWTWRMPHGTRQTKANPLWANGTLSFSSHSFTWSFAFCMLECLYFFIYIITVADFSFFATGCESFLRNPSQISACAMQLSWNAVDVQLSASLTSHVLCNLKQTATTKTKQSRTSRGFLREPRCINQRKHRRLGAQEYGLKSVRKSVFIMTKARCISRVSLRSKVHKYSAIVRECWRLLYLGFKFVLSQDLLMLFGETRFYSIARSDGSAKLSRGK